MKKKLQSICLVLILCAALSACGKTDVQESVSKADTEAVQESGGQEADTKASAEPETTEAETGEKITETETAEPETAATETAKSETAGQETKAQAFGKYADNFAVDEPAVKEYGEWIKEAVNAKNIEALADLTGFPVYAGFPDESKVINTREEFIALGADRIFTQEFIDSVGNADLSGQQASMAGFVMMTGEGPNVIFGVVDGELRITGYNY